MVKLPHVWSRLRKPSLAPKPIRAERTEKLPEQVLLVMASEQRRVFIAVFLFFLSMPMGLAALLGSGLYLLGPALLALCLALWMACTTAFFLFVAYLSYRPVKEITTWLEANVPEDAK